MSAAIGKVKEYAERMEVMLAGVDAPSPQRTWELAGLLDTELAKIAEVSSTARQAVTGLFQAAAVARRIRFAFTTAPKDMHWTMGHVRRFAAATAKSLHEAAPMGGRAIAGCALDACRLLPSVCLAWWPKFHAARKPLRPDDDMPAPLHMAPRTAATPTMRRPRALEGCEYHPVVVRTSRVRFAFAAGKHAWTSIDNHTSLADTWCKTGKLLHFLYEAGAPNVAAHTALGMFSYLVPNVNQREGRKSLAAMGLHVTRPIAAACPRALERLFTRGIEKDIGLMEQDAQQSLAFAAPEDEHA